MPPVSSNQSARRLTIHLICTAAKRCPKNATPGSTRGVCFTVAHAEHKRGHRESSGNKCHILSRKQPKSIAILGQ